MPAPRAYFHQVEFATPAERLAGQCYIDPDRDLVGVFERLNGLRRGEMVYPGQTLLIPERDGSAGRTAAILGPIAAQAGWRARNGASPPASRFFNDSFNGIVASLGDPGASDYGFAIADAFLGGGGHYVRESFRSLESDLRSLNRSYVTDALRKAPRSKANPTRFSHGAATRRALFKRMQGTMDALPARMTGAMPAVSRANSGVAHALVKKSVRASGDATELTKIRKAIFEIDDLGRTVSKRARIIGVGLTALDGAVDIASLHSGIAQVKREAPDKADVYGAYRGARSIGGVAGGFAGGEAGMALGGVAAAVFFASNPLGWGAQACIGVGAIAGSIIGKATGEGVAGAAMEQQLMSIDASRKADIDWVKDRIENE